MSIAHAQGLARIQSTGARPSTVKGQAIATSALSMPGDSFSRSAALAPGMTIGSQQKSSGPMTVHGPDGHIVLYRLSSSHVSAYGPDGRTDLYRGTSGHISIDGPGGHTDLHVSSNGSIAVDGPNGHSDAYKLASGHFMIEGPAGRTELYRHASDSFSLAGAKPDMGIVWALLGFDL